jgi:iron complex transport system substrate-binding protein
MQQIYRVASLRLASGNVLGRFGFRRQGASLALLILLCLSSSLALASRVVTDEAGRRVTLPDHPHRIICLVPSVTDAVFALGAGADVVAISDYTKYPVAALSKPSVGNPIHPSLEVLISLHPDLVLGIQTSSPIDSLLQIERLGIPVYLVNPRGLDGLLRSVSSLGVALHREDDATALVASLKRRIAAVRTQTEGLPRPTVFMPIWYDPIMTIGKHAFITEIIAAAGGRSITDDLTPEWPQISLEALIGRAPQALLLTRGGKTTLDVLKDKPGWAAVSAVQHGRVFYADDRIEFASPVAIDALEDLSHQFHP